MAWTRSSVLPPLLAALCASSGTALAGDEKVPVYRAGIDIVNVTVTVRDARGRLINDLSAVFKTGSQSLSVFRDGGGDRAVRDEP